MLCSDFKTKNVLSKWKRKEYEEHEARVQCGLATAEEGPDLVKRKEHLRALEHLARQLDREIQINNPLVRTKQLEECLS